MRLTQQQGGQKKKNISILKNFVETKGGDDVSGIVDVLQTTYGFTDKKVSSLVTSIVNQYKTTCNQYKRYWLAFLSQSGYKRQELKKLFDLDVKETAWKSSLEVEKDITWAPGKNPKTINLLQRFYLFSQIF